MMPLLPLLVFAAPCFCTAGKTVTPAGEVLYNTTQRDGKCRVAICRPDCSGVEASVVPCPATTAFVTAVRTTAKPPPTRPPPTKAPPTKPPPTKPPPIGDCDALVPPRALGETWNTADCMVATCLGSGSKVSMEKRPCTELPAPVCVSGRKPVRAPDVDGCCFHWQCDCLCTGYGDPHMRTFDGAKFTLLDPCSYVLLQEKQKTYDLSISAEFFDCDARHHVSCPRTLIIAYKGNELRVGLASEVDFALRKIQLNGQTKKAPFTDKGFQVSSVKTDDFVVIADIRVKIQFNGLGFLIDVPRELFGDNTEGQCGRCNNDRTDDCSGRDGASRPVDNCCLSTAQDWLIADAARPQCVRPQLPPGGGCKPPPPPPADCEGAKICDQLILENFKSCKDDVDLSVYHEGCKFDHCVANRTEIDCSSAQTAAAECGRVGKCVDWRSLSQGRCPFECPGQLVYKACAAKVEITCGVETAEEGSVWVGEGCFCPEGQKLQEAGSDVCVDACPDCWTSDHIPKYAGDTWLEGCDQKSCLAGGQVESSAVPCLQPTPSCPPGVNVVPAAGADACCPALQCDACVYGDKSYEVGSSWRHPSDSCVQFSCAAHQGSAALVETVTSCAAFDLSSCKSPPTYDESGCCPVQCERNDTSRPKCDSFTTSESISVGSCVSEPVELGHCSGNCPSSTR
ncbi:intestinal mucin-like protein [Lampetra fluviatilis]